MNIQEVIETLAGLVNDVENNLKLNHKNIRHYNVLSALQNAKETLAKYRRYNDYLCQQETEYRTSFVCEMKNGQIKKIKV